MLLVLQVILGWLYTYQPGKHALKTATSDDYRRLIAIGESTLKNTDEHWREIPVERLSFARFSQGLHELNERNLNTKGTKSTKVLKLLRALRVLRGEKEIT